MGGDHPRRFILNRHQDVSGVSGVGPVAEGVIWTDGTATVRWFGEYGTTVFHDKGLESILRIHGHDGKTSVDFLD